ncbi:ATP-binding protein/SpoIIE family protein phosphatase [Rhodocytophaga aerolata]|uniref:ATP-binding protein/SpoIIE family protein phosphatase n=1 Tax=Rhodocytophaga aerolata TaxID=455078 RepID=A0ABT8R0E5_9BACT|nr:ATP-binding SpoIIE family protein phosphatase [Rhodocytophaga aerolata]MDO1445560.1 ATP-binding protein/SpoIIE family protein phosphatase [Rhodocytophaga aerolata]
MEFNAHHCFPVSDRSYLSLTKREIQKLAESYGFTEAKLGKIDIVASELASNLIKHTTSGGEILVKALGMGRAAGIEIISVDNGPGMVDVLRMMQDGVSTVGSQGEGLGAIKRLSHEFDIYSQPEQGTVVLSRIYLTEKDRKKNTGFNQLDVRAVMVAKTGETYCGDAWRALPVKDGCVIMAADGLGHGEEAHMASTQAVAVLSESLAVDPAGALRIIHQEIKRTRGAVGAVAFIQSAAGKVSFCGIGNIGGKVLSLEVNKSLISYNGILGHNIPNTIHNHQFSWSDTSIVLLHSDGLKSRWEFSKYPLLRLHDPSVMAAVLYKDHTRKIDDILVIAGKQKK